MPNNCLIREGSLPATGCSGRRTGLGHGGETRVDLVIQAGAVRDPFSPERENNGHAGSIAASEKNVHSVQIMV